MPYGLPFVDEYGRTVGNREETDASVLAARNSANAAASVPLTMLAPDPSLPGPLGYLPLAGAAEGTVGVVDYLGRTGADILNQTIKDNPTGLAAKWGWHIPSPPEWMRAAGEHFEQNRGQIKTGLETYTGGALKAPDVETPEGQVADIIGSAAGGGVGIAPTSAIMPLLKVLPKVARPVASLLLPTTGHMATNIPLSTAIGTTQGAIDLAANEAQAKEENVASAAATPPSTTAMVEKAVQPPPAVDRSSLFNPPVTKASQVVTPDRSTLFDMPATPATPDRSSIFDMPPGPTFTQQGDSGVPMWAMLGGMVVTLGALHAGRYTHGLGREMTTAARDQRYNNPKLAAETQKYNDEVIARGAGSNTAVPPSGAAMNAPTPEGNIIRRTTVNTANAAVNDAAKLQEHIHMSSNDPSTGERLSSAVGNMFDSQLQHNKAYNFLESGYDKRTGLTVPSVNDMLVKFEALTEDQKRVSASGLRALNEMNNRQKNTVAWARDHPGVPPTLTDIAHDLVGHPMKDLQDMAATMRADPQLVDLEQHFKGVSKGTLDVGVHPAYGFFTPEEHGRIMKAHPDYVPEMDINGKPVHPFGERNTGALTGQAQVTTHPVIDMAQHVEQLYPLFERNKVLGQELYTHYKNVQRTYPNSPQFMQDVTSPTGPHQSYYPLAADPGGGQVRDPITTVRFRSGVKHVRVDEKNIFDAMSGKSITAARVRLDALNKMRRVLQQGTTGAASIATGRIMPLRNMYFAGQGAALNAPTPIRAGGFDFVSQHMLGTKTRLGYTASKIARGVDMIATPVLGAPASYGIGVFDRRVNNLAQWFDPKSDNHINRSLRASIGDAPVDAMQQYFKNWYETSGTKWLKDTGVSGQGSPMHLEAPGVVTGARGSGDPKMGVHLQSARLRPKAFFSADWRGAKPFVLNLQHAVTETLGHISDASHDFIHRLNRNNPDVHPDVLTYEMRNLVGNPSRGGGNRYVQGATSVVPYANVSMQGIGRYMRAAGETPGGSAMTLATGLGTMALISIITHMQSAAHMDFLQNQLSLQQREANVSLATSDDPTSPMMIPLEQGLRAPYALALDIMSKGINLIAARHDKDTFHGVWEGIKDFLGSHITTSNMNAIKHGLIDTFDFATGIPIAGKVDLNSLSQGKSLADSVRGITSGPASSSNLPGQVPDTALDSKQGQIFVNILSNLFGAIAHTVDTGNSIARYYQQGHPFWDSMGMGIHDWIQQAKESNMSMNTMLFETPIRLSSQPPIAEMLQPTLYDLKNLPPMTSEGRIGYTSGRTQLQVPTGQQQVSSDLRMGQLLQSAHGYKTRIDLAMEPINALNTQINAYSRQAMVPEERRQWINQQKRVIADRYKMVDALSDDMFNTLSKIAGKPINKLSSIDWQKDSTQFRK